MFIYRKCRTAGYISPVHYFRFEHFLLTILFISLSLNLKVLSYKVIFWRDMLNKYIMFSNSIFFFLIILISILTKIIMIMIFPIIKQH